MILSSKKTSISDKDYYKLSIRGYSPLFTYLKTKKSYDWWVTRRVWGFRHKISKAKYLKISKIKYLKISQNVGGKYQEASGEHYSTCAKWLLSYPGRCYKRIRICVSGEV